MRNRKRMVARVVGALLCGAAVSMVVAWGMQVIVTPPAMERSFGAAQDSRGDWWMATAIRWVDTSTISWNLYITQVEAEKNRDWFIDWARRSHAWPNGPSGNIVEVEFSRPSWSALDSLVRTTYAPVSGAMVSQDRVWTCWEMAQGWPMRCVHGGMVTVPTAMADAPAASVGMYQAAGYNFAYRPLVLGLVANTAFYAGVIVVCVGGGRRIVRAVRRRGGRCGGCGYDRRGLGAGVACPECGDCGPGAQG